MPEVFGITSLTSVKEIMDWIVKAPKNGENKITVGGRAFTFRSLGLDNYEFREEGREIEGAKTSLNLARFLFGIAREAKN